ncbi:MAG: glycosyltransferase family 2 protein [Rhodospirillaceae bacterium]
MISVVIATRNRAGALSRCLDALARQAADGLAWEAVVVDNGSTDATAAMIDRFASGGALPLRRAFEPRPGVSAARNRGIAAARHPVLAFTDDDCLPEPGWLAAIAVAFAAVPAPALVGGRVDLHDDADVPVAIRPFDMPAAIDGFDRVRSHLIGCNFVATRRLFDRIGGFDETLGPGTWSRAGEDLELFCRAVHAGARIVFDPAVRVRHAHGRRDPGDVVGLGRSYTRGCGAVLGARIRAGQTTLWRPAYWEFRGLVAGALRPGPDLPAPAAWRRVAEFGAAFAGRLIGG